MKRLLLIPLLSLCVVLTSCSPSGDFWGAKAVIVHKDQDGIDKEKKQARYTIYFDKPGYNSIILIFSEDWGDVGDIVTGGKKGTIVAEKKSVKVEKE